MWKTICSERLIDSEWVKVDRDDVIVSNGVEITDFYKITIKDCSAVVALTEDKEIILKKEYRYCYGEELIEIPAGVLERGENSLDAAKRELLEETGYSSEEWLYLGKTIESSAKLTNYMHIFLAKNCRKVAAQQLDAGEIVKTFTVPLDDVIAMIMDCRICCSSSIGAILKVVRMIEHEL